MSKHFVRFDQMTWPLPNNDLIWRLTHGGEVSRGDAILAASIVGAYASLIFAKDRKRRIVIREIRKATLDDGQRDD